MFESKQLINDKENETIIEFSCEEYPKTLNISLNAPIATEKRDRSFTPKFIYEI